MNRRTTEALRKRAAPFALLTGPGSRYQELRDKTYQRLLSAFQQATPGGIVERLTVPQLRGYAASSSHADLFVYWSDVEKYLGDADSVLRFPSETFRYCGWLVEFLSYSCPELVQLGYELRGIREQVEGTHLRGSFLLVTAHDTLHSIPQDAGRYRNLRATIVQSPGTIAAINAAAADLAAALPVDDGRTPMATESRRSAGSRD